MAAITPKDGPVAVTGASGLLGGHMVRELVVHGYHVRACIRDGGSWRGKDSMDYLSRLPNVEIIDRCDLFIPGSFDAAFRGCSAVFHHACVVGSSADGKSQPHGSGDRFDDLYSGNLAGNRNVIDAVNASGSVKRVAYTSSIAAVVAGYKIASVGLPYEWTETDWSYEEAPTEYWESPENSYPKSKVESERLFNTAADESNGQWDVISICPGAICGPILFKAQLGQYIEQIGRMASGLEIVWENKNDTYYNIIDVRDLAKGHRLAAESAIDHKATHGGNRYMMHGSGGRSALRLSTDMPETIGQLFPGFVLGPLPVTVDENGEPLYVWGGEVTNDCKKAKSVLGATIRPVEDTIRDVIESQIELGVITPQLK